MPDTIQSIYSNNIKYILVFVGMILVVIAIFAWRDKGISTKSIDYRVTAALDSLRAITTQQQVIIHDQQLRYTQDSIHLVSIEQQVARVPDMIQSINNKYNVQKHSITNLFPDQQLQLFSTWLPTTDSIQR